MTEATDPQDRPVEPVSQLLARGVKLRLSIRHGISSINICNGAAAPQIYSATTFWFDPTRTYPSTAKACDPVASETQYVLARFFRPSVDWHLEDSELKRLTLVNPDGTTYRFVEEDP